MEQIWTFITDHTLYVAAGYAMILLVLMVLTLHRINRSIRLQKKQMKNMQDTILNLFACPNGNENEEKTAVTDTAAGGEKGQAVAMAGWTSEQEHLVNEVLGEVFS